jgi:hypothetical protein
MRYSMLQLFLARRLGSDDLFATFDPATSRDEHLKRVFSVETSFLHYKRAYVYKPFSSPNDQHIVGVIAKEHTVTVSGPPEEAFVHKQVEDWETANVVIDLAQQMVAVQPTVGQPIHIFRSLTDHINNSYPDADWAIAINPITRTEQFWSAAERYQGHITELDLSFEVPNIWGGQSATEKALSELKTQNNAQEVEVKIKNRDGQLNPNSERIRNSISYITQGGGTVRLRDDDQNTVYSSDSEENIVTVAVEPDFPVQQADEGMLLSLLGRLFDR